MGRLNVSDLPYPSKPYRIDRLKGGPSGGPFFESRTNARAEDFHRAKSLTKVATRFPNSDPTAALDLARRLASGQSSDRTTLASSRYMRRCRLRLIGALWPLVADGPWTLSEVSSFTAIPRGWSFSPETLETADPSKLLARFRSQLNRAGAKEADGFLIAHLHGEFDPQDRVFKIHAHGIAAGGMIAVIDRLRTTPSYASDELVRVRMHIRRKPLKDIPYPLGYPFKSYWPCRRIGAVGDEGLIKRQRRHGRIPEPYHSQVLLWLDRWSASDLTLLMNLRVGRDGFVASNIKNVHQFEGSGE